MSLIGHHAEPGNDGPRDARAPALDAAIAQVRQQRTAERRRLDQTSEDSYATRLETRERIDVLDRLLHRLRTAQDGRVDLGIGIEDWGYDPEAAASDAACGLDHVSAADQQANLYQQVISGIADAIAHLEAAGFRVSTTVTIVRPEVDDGDARDEDLGDSP